jgi:hypothetical protein
MTERAEGAAHAPLQLSRGFRLPAVEGQQPVVIPGIGFQHSSLLANANPAHQIVHG